MSVRPSDIASALRLRLPSPVEEVDDVRLRNRGVRLFLERDDLIHPEMPGNKWRKLKYNLEAARAAHRRAQAAETAREPERSTRPGADDLLEYRAYPVDSVGAGREGSTTTSPPCGATRERG